jgi:hypothetical protein
MPAPRFTAVLALLSVLLAPPAFAQNSPPVNPVPASIPPAGSKAAAPPTSVQPTPPPTLLPQPTPGVQPTQPPSTGFRRSDPFAPLPYYTRKNNWFYGGALDFRYRTLTTSGDKETVGSYIAAARATIDFVRANPETGDERGGVRMQLVLEDDARKTSLNRVRASEVYGYYQFLFPGVSATVRVGQFVLPFGLIAVYDTPLQLVQPLYEKSLGLRVDTGIALEGYYGSQYHYGVALTTGAGPNRKDPDTNMLVTFRLERAFQTRNGNVQVGGSLLNGYAPRTGFNTELPPSGYASGGSYVKKSRFAADGTWMFKAFTGRGEIMFGSDDDKPVWGYFAEGNWRIRGPLNLLTFVKRWNFPNKPESAGSIGGGADVVFAHNFSARLLYEYERDVPFPAGSATQTTRRLTLQGRVDF